MKKLLILFFALSFSSSIFAMNCKNRTTESADLIIYVVNCAIPGQNNQPLTVTAKLKDTKIEPSNVLIGFNNKFKIVTVNKGDLAVLISEDHYKDGFDKVEFNFHPTKDQIIMYSQ
jgi:hypothetical protein